MAKHLPFGHSFRGDETAKVSYWGGRGETELIDIRIDSEEWFTWLEQTSSFRMVYIAKTGTEPLRFTVRSESRKSGKSERTYWQAWKTVKGKLFKRYIGPTSKMTKDRLDEAGQWFYEKVQAGQEPDREEHLMAANKKLVALVEELIENCKFSCELVDYAKNELEKVRGEVT